MNIIRKNLSTIAVSVVVGLAFGVAIVLINIGDEKKRAKQDAYAAHIRATCKQLERNKPERGNRYDVFDCNGIKEWVYVSQ